MVDRLLALQGLDVTALLGGLHWHGIVWVVLHYNRRNTISCAMDWAIQDWATLKLFLQMIFFKLHHVVNGSRIVFVSGKLIL